MLQLEIPINSDGEAFTFPLEEPHVSIGRRHDNDIRIKETYISAYHAELNLGPDGQYYLRDRESSNGTFHNGRRVTEKKVVVERGDILKFGSLKCYVNEALGVRNRGLALAGVASEDRYSVRRESFGGKGALTSGPRNRVSVSRGGIVLSVEDRDGRSNGVGSDDETGSIEIAADDSDFFVKKLRLLESDQEKLRDQLRAAQKELDESRSELLSKTEELSAEREKAAEREKDHQSSIARLEDRLNSKELETKRLSRKVREAIGEIDQLRNQIEVCSDPDVKKLQAALDQLQVAKSESTKLHEGLELLKTERDKLRKQCLDLVQKLQRTREGFSFFLHSSNRKRIEATRRNAELVAENEEKTKQLKSTTEELEKLKEVVRRMKNEREEWLTEKADSERKAEELAEKRAKKAVRESSKQVHRELHGVCRELKANESRLREFERLLKSVAQETASTETTLRKKNRKLEETNRKLQGDARDLKTFEATVRKTGAEAERLEEQRSGLLEETGKLSEEKNHLVGEITRLTAEHLKLNETVVEEREESDRVAEKLNDLVSKLKDSERRVVHLRELEHSLERSVARARQNALSRRGIYSEDARELAHIWPETEELICRELIEKMELLEDLLRSYQKKRFVPRFAEQLSLLQDSFMALLESHSVDRFQLEPGTELSPETRKRIQLVNAGDLDDSRLKRISSKKKGTAGKTTVVETIRPGYVYRKGGKDTVIRKAEVIVS